jgi:branched-chain amino acid transport system permease protein
MLSTMPGLPPTAGPILQYAGYAIVLIVCLLLIPRGIAPSIASLGKRTVARLRPRQTG